MTTPLMRDDLRPLYDAAQDAPHLGLLLQRGLPEHREGGEARTRHVARVCGSGHDEKARGKGESHGRSAPAETARTHDADGFYRRAYGRWERATSDNEMRFRSVVLKIETRLFIGLTGGGMLETGCAIGHSHGAPYIPGSSVKGVVNAHARERFDAERREDGRAVCDELFGAPATADRPAGLSGLLTFHDAWWVPESADRPLAPEIVTTHHPEYYGQDGRTPATDFDSPVPNAQIAVHGAFRFVIEGPPAIEGPLPAAWLVLAEQILVAALSTRGAGAKTRTGYGLFGAEAVVEAGPRCEWVDKTIADLVVEHRNTPEETILRGSQLAQIWDALENPVLKREAFSDIRSRWQERGWWDDPPQGKSAKKARAIYDGYSVADDPAR